MKEAIVIREKTGNYTLRVKDVWYRHINYQEAFDILLLHGFDERRMLREAITIPDPLDLEYKPKGWGRRSWLVNGRPQRIAVVRYLLSEQGCKKQVIDTIIRSEKLLYRIREYLNYLKSPAA